MIEKVILRFLESRFSDNWLRKLSMESRLALLSGVWRGLNKGINLGERFDLMAAAYDDRLFRNYSLLSSRNQAKIYGLFSIVNEVKAITGDIVEAGVGMGVSFATLGYAISYYKIDKRLYGFDSFQGFPQGTKEDLSPRVKNNEVIGWDNTSENTIQKIFERDRIKMPKWFSLLRDHDIDVRLFPGFFAETLAKNLPRKIALLHVDCDLYESYKLVLEAGFPRMSPGGYIIFDEYNDDNWPGATRAADEFTEKYKLSLAYYAPLNKYVIQIP